MRNGKIENAVVPLLNQNSAKISKKNRDSSLPNSIMDQQKYVKPSELSLDLIMPNARGAKQSPLAQQSLIQIP
jgi:hypothetical protein